MTADKVSSTDVDSVLDEIDGVPESNAEEFVRSFVQEGRAVTRADVGRLGGRVHFWDHSRSQVPRRIRPGCCPDDDPAARPVEAPHGTTIVA